MPPYSTARGFLREIEKLSSQQQAAFMKAVALFRADLATGNGFRRSLRVKKMTGHDDIWEMTWAPDGRATFHYGTTVRDGHHHVVWRRIGGHEIFDRP